jgi:hypothetical protein
MGKIKSLDEVFRDKASIKLKRQITSYKKKIDVITSVPFNIS